MEKARNCNRKQLNEKTTIRKDCVIRGVKTMESEERQRRTGIHKGIYTWKFGLKS